MDRRKRTARTVALMSLFSMTDTRENVPVASFDGDGSDLISLIVGIEPIQAGSGDPSLDNVRPISGWTGANIHVSPTTDAADGTTYSITFPTSAGTVYGGTLDVTTGKLTVDMAYIDNLAYLEWSKVSPYKEFRANYAANNIPIGFNVGDDVISNLRCSIMAANKPSRTYRGIENGIALSNVYISVGDADGLWPDVESFKNAISRGQLAYEIATPIVYDLTPTEINTLLGANNIWADTGEIKYIEYNV